MSNAVKQSMNFERLVDSLSDSELQEVNGMFKWNSFTMDIKGRRVGNIAFEGKRDNVQQIPDRRIQLMDKIFHLGDKSVLELGCFEGIHTIGLSMYSKKIIAVDSRIQNVIKTILRCSLYGYSPKIIKCDIESREFDPEQLKSDLMLHIGVLYHLKNPVEHMLQIGSYITKGILLDTHYCLDSEVNNICQNNGYKFEYKEFRESGYNNVFAGMYDHAKWLKLDDIRYLLKETGFTKTEIIEKRNERNGPRALIVAYR